MAHWAEWKCAEVPFVVVVLLTISPSSSTLCLRRRADWGLFWGGGYGGAGTAVLWRTGTPLSLRSAGGKAKRRLFATSSTLSKLLTPLYFHPRSLPDSSRPERRCKNKRDVWISAHKRLTTHARRVALFCLYLGIFPRPRFRVISRRQMASWAIGRQVTARTGGQFECEGAG